MARIFSTALLLFYSPFSRWGVRGDSAAPRANVLNSMGSVGNAQNIRLVADIPIPDGRTLFLPIHVPPVAVGVNASGPATVTSVTSLHANGLFGVGEVIDVDVRYSSAVDVVGTPSLRMRTGCHSPSCQTKEIQTIFCTATSGYFSVSFQGETSPNIPYNVPSMVLTDYLLRLTAIKALTITYDDAGTSACTFRGTTITIQFDQVNVLGTDGDLPSLVTDRLNAAGSMPALLHHTFPVQLTATAIEVQKGVSPIDRVAPFLSLRTPSTLTFRYTVQYGDVSTNLDYTSTDALSLNAGGAIYNTGTTTAASLTLPVPGRAPTWATGMLSSLAVNCAIALNSNVPTVTNVYSTHANGIFGVGELIEIKIVFSLPVLVRGTPTLLLVTGVNTAVAPVVRTESGGSVVVAQYVVSAGDYSLDLTYVSTNPFVLNGGSVSRLSTNSMMPASLTLPASGVTGSLFNNADLVIDTTPPYIVSITSNQANGVFTTGDVLTFTLLYSRAVAVTGTPYFKLATGVVDLCPGFYIVRAPTNGNANIMTFPKEVNWSWLQPGFRFVVGGNTFTVASISNLQVTTVETYTGPTVDMGVLLTSPQLQIFTCGYQYATYTSGSPTASLQFAYTVQRGDTSLDLATSSNVLLPAGSSILRQSTTPATAASLTMATAGTLGSLDTVAQLVIDTTPPFVVSVTSPTRSGVYGTGNVVGIVVTFSQPVVVVGPSPPGMLMNVGEGRFALYASGSGSPTLLFQLTITASDQAAALAPLSLDAIRMPNVFTSICRKSMAPSNTATLTLPGPTLGGSTLVIDPAAATVTQLAIVSPLTSSFRPGDAVNIAVTFSQPVAVTGTPVLDLTVGTAATYLSGTTTSTLVFLYVVQFGDRTLSLDIASVDAIRLNGGSTITAVATGNAANLVLTNVALRGAPNAPFLPVDPSPFVVAQVLSWTIDGVYTVGDTLLLEVIFSDVVVVAGTPQLLLRTGNSAGDQPAAFHSADANLVYFAYAVQAGDAINRVVEGSVSALQCINDVGLNANPLVDASSVSGADWGGRLVVSWSEQGAVRVRAFNNNPSMPLWTTLSSGLNADMTQVASGSACASAGSGSLVCAWQETTAGGSSVIHVAAMTGTLATPAWTRLSGTGLNVDATKAAGQVAVTTTSVSTIVVTWQEVAANGQTTLHVRGWNGNVALPAWTNLDPTSTILIATSNLQDPTLAAMGTQLVLAWTEMLPGGATSKLRVATNNGVVWVSLDSTGNGLNAAARLATKPALSVCNGVLYAGWQSTDAGGGAYIRLRSYNAVANTWAFIDGGVGLQTTGVATVARLTLSCFQNALVAAWMETRTGVVTWNRALSYNSATNTWSTAGVANDNPLQPATAPVLAVSGPTLYMAWIELHAINTNQQVHVAMFVPPQLLWQSMTYSCIKRVGSGFSIPVALGLPNLFTQHSLTDSSHLALDTSTPTVVDIQALSPPGLYGTVDTVQTIAVVGAGSAITLGAYSIGYNGVSSTCIAWNAANTDVQAAINALPGLGMAVTVTALPAAFQLGSLYTVVFTTPANGIHPFTLGTGCAPLTCADGSTCGRVLINAPRSSPFASTLQPGYVDLQVLFSSPVQVTGAAPVLALTNGVTATYTAAAPVQTIDVGVGGPSPLLAGGFALSYGGATTTGCIDIQSINQDYGSLQYQLLLLPAVATIGIASVQATPYRNGLRYTIRFQPGTPLALSYAPSVACTPLTGLIQTIDLVSTATVTAGGFLVGYGTLVGQTCVAVGATSLQLQAAINALTNQEVQVAVQKHPLPTGGYRYQVVFPNANAATSPLTVKTAGCTALACAGGTCSFAVNADYTIGVAFTSALTFRYAIHANDVVPVLGYVGLTGGIVRASSSPPIPASLSLPPTLSPSRIQVNTLAIATVTGVAATTSNGVYSQGNRIYIALTFTAAVHVTGQPTLELNSNGLAFYKSGSESRALVFEYIVGAGQTTGDLDSFSPWSLRFPTPGTGIYTLDATTNALTPVSSVLPVAASPTSLASQSAIVIDAVVPTVVAVTSTKAAGLYGAGEAIDILVQFSHPVLITGTPSIALNSGGAALFTLARQRQLLDIGVTASASITSGQYAVWYQGMLSECIDFNNVAMLQTKLLDLPGVGAIGLTSVSAAAYGNGQRVTIIFAAPDAHTAPLELVPATPPQCLPLHAGNNDQLLVLNGLDAFVTFRYTVQATDATAALAITSPAIVLNSGTIRRRSDHASIDVNPTLVAATLNAMQISGVVPTITQTAMITAGGSYGVAYPPTPSPSYVKPGQILLTLTFSHAVVFLGVVTIQMNTGHAAQLYAQLSPTQFSFVYTVQAGDAASNFDFASPTALQGTIVGRSSTNSQAINPLLPMLGLTGANIVVVDCALPAAIMSITTTHTDGMVGAGEVVAIQTTFGRPVRMLSGLNHNSLLTAQYQSSTEFNGILYLAWTEQVSVAVSLVYVAQSDGTTFQELSPAASLNADPVRGQAGKTSILVFNGQLYVAWDESGVVQLARYGGNVGVWTRLPFMASNAALVAMASAPVLVAYMNTLFLVWQEYKVGHVDVTNIRVASQDATRTPPWYIYDTAVGQYGLNTDRATDATALVFASHLYLAWTEFNTTQFNVQIYTLSLSSLSFVKIPQVGYIPTTFLTAFGPKLFSIRNQLMVQWYTYPAASVQPIMHTGVVMPQYWREAPSTTMGTTPGYTLDVQTCANGVAYIAWTLQSTTSMQLFTATVDINGNLTPQPAVVVNHNPNFDTVGPKLTCWPAVNSVALTWTEFDGVSYKLRLATSPFAVLPGLPFVWTESRAGSATLQLTNGLVAVNTDKSGSCLSTLTFQLVVASGTPAVAQLNALAFSMNRARVDDCVSFAIANVVVSPTAPDTRSLAFSSHIAIDTSTVTVVDVSTTLPAGTYGAGQVIPLIVTFSAPVTISASMADGSAPAWILCQSLVASIDGVHDHMAPYSTGNGTAALTFLYTVLPTDQIPVFDYMLPSSLQLNATAWLRRSATIPTDDARVTLPYPGQGHSVSRANIVVDTTAPVVVDVTATTANGVYYVGDVIQIVVTFSLPVAVMGTPTLALNTCGATPCRNVATYVRGSGTTQLVFAYTVQRGDQTTQLGLFDDRPSAQVSFVVALSANDGAIFRQATYPTMAAMLPCPAPGTSHAIAQSIALDSTIPTITAMTSIMPDGTYDIGTVIPIQIVFSAPVVVTGTPFLILNVFRDATRGGLYSAGSGTATLTFLYTVELGDTAWPLDAFDMASLLAKMPMRDFPLQGPPFATIYRLSTNPSLPADLTLPPLGATLPQINTPPNLIRGGHLINIRTDGVRVGKIDTSTANGTYAAGQVIVLTVHYSQAVAVVGVPRLALTVPATQAVYTSGSGTPTLVFTYTTAPGDATPALDVTTVVLGPTVAIRDLQGRSVPVAVPAPRSTLSLSGGGNAIAISTLAPVIRSIQSPSINAAFAGGDSVQFGITFSAPVVVTGAAPQVLMNTLHSATYVSGSGTPTLTFTYTVVAGDTGMLDYATVTALTGTILAKSTVPTTLATLTLPAAPGAAGSLSATSQLQLNTQAPTVVDVSFAGLPSQVCPVGTILGIQIQFSYPIAVTGSPILMLATKGNGNQIAAYVGGAGSMWLHFTYTVQVGDATTMLEYTDIHALRGTILQFSVAPTVPAVLTLPIPGSPASLSGKPSFMSVCLVCPQVVSVTGPPSGVYTVGHVLPFVVTFSQPVQFAPPGPPPPGTTNNPPPIAPPTLQLRLAMAFERFAIYTSGAGTSTWSFTYTVQPNDDVYPVDVANTYALFGSPVVSVASSALHASLLVPAPGRPGSISSSSSIRIVSFPPIVLTVTSPTPDGVYGPGHAIPIDVLFSGPVVVTGAPTLQMGLLPTPRAAIYNAAGSTLTTVRFIYTVQPGDTVFRLDYMRVCSNSADFMQLEGYDSAETGLACLPVGTASAIQLNGGTIRAVATTPTVDANLALPSVNPWPAMRYIRSDTSIVFSTTNAAAPNQQSVCTFAPASTTSPPQTICTFVKPLAPPTQPTSPPSVCTFNQDGQQFLILANGIPNHAYPPSVAAATYLFELPRYPGLGFVRTRPVGIVGFMLNGVPIANANGGPIAPDGCGGIVDPTTKHYVYAAQPTCIISSPTSLMGYALDGFPIYALPSSAQPLLDECNGVFGPDGVYRYYLNPTTIQASGTFLPCFKGIVPMNNNGQRTALTTTYTAVAGVGGFQPSPVNLQNLLVVPQDLGGVWLNAASVSITSTATTLIVSSTGMPDGSFGPFPNPLNSNWVIPQNYQFRIPRTPVKAAAPTTLPLQAAIGVALNGIPLYNTINQDGNSVLDARIAGHLTLDKCNGYVDANGAYVYYAPPNCLLDTLGEVLGRPSPLIGYAFDGFPIYGRYGASGAVPTLDACNGRLNDVGTYQYHVTDTPPYTIGCFYGVVNPSTVPMFRSLSTTSAIKIDAAAPYITDITTLRTPGTFVVGNVIDFRVLWSVPIVVAGGLPTLTLAVVNNRTRVPAIATYDPTTSNAQTSVFLYTVGADEFIRDLAVASPTALQLPVGVSIRRAATTPTLNAILTCPVSTLGQRLQAVANVQVNVRGLYHPDAQDLSVSLVHNDIRALMWGPIPMSGYSFGRPANEAQRPGIEDQTSAIGYDYTFGDAALGPNLALSGLATQSTTFGPSGAAVHAIDGVRSAFYSSASLTRTLGDPKRDPTPWWQLRLDTPSPIGTIRIFNVAQQVSQFEVQIVTVDGPIPVVGTFSLLVGTCTTPMISVAAVAMRADETSFGESVQAKLEACSGQVSVSRSAPNRMGGYAWTITFVQDVGTIARMSIAAFTQPTLEATVTTLFDSTDNVWYNYQDVMHGVFDDTLFPCYVMIFDALSEMNFETVTDALAVAKWSTLVTSSNEIETTLVVPSQVVGQYIRIQHNNPLTLSLAEVEVYAAVQHSFSSYFEGSPVAPFAYDSTNTPIQWAPQVSFGYAFGGQSGGGRWDLVIQDLRPSLGQLEDEHPLQGQGGLSEWNLVVTNTAGTTTTYYLPLTARIQTIPKYGDLLVDIKQSETDHLDSQGNDYLDQTEAIAYLTTYWPLFQYLDTFVQFRILQDTIDTYATTGLLKVYGQMGQQRWIPETCEGPTCVPPPSRLELYNSMSVAMPQHILDKTRTVQYLPSPAYVGLDDFTFTTSLDTQVVPGLVRIQVLKCRDATCLRDVYLAQSYDQPGIPA
ncbi:Aste57867_24559 [Aphanomyces stellatus]|uniref:Aste57867_24559 protein n=1 Tax=Aphanomyces stellatus TaxID=120398 RepID=A0A485LQN7_9STRA|nr:hypothetical protein As57867_024481 [Aphanomyces stellatus]VFU01198.1 Aste57867_24559 [Aphanomyces stellatus]